MEKMKMESVNMTEQNIERIGALFPNCITEMLDEEKSISDNKVYKKTVNFEMLKQMLEINNDSPKTAVKRLIKEYGLSE